MDCKISFDYHKVTVETSFTLTFNFSFGNLSFKWAYEDEPELFQKFVVGQNVVMDGISIVDGIVHFSSHREDDSWGDWPAGIVKFSVPFETIRSQIKIVNELWFEKMWQHQSVIRKSGKKKKGKTN